MKRILFVLMFLPVILRGQNINKLEYFFDTDPGFGNGVDVLITAALDIANFNFSADVSAVSTGFHTLYVRSRDENGKWSETGYRTFYKPTVEQPLPTIVEIEYFVNTDPGFGNGIKKTVAAANFFLNFSFNACLLNASQGANKFYIRTKDNNGKWSETTFLDFTYSGVPVTDCNVVLSVELMDFQVTKKDKNINVSWQTAFERNVSHFDIERSNDGKTFTKIGEQKAVGGLDLAYYKAFDNTPQYGINYYRLKIVDRDGNVDFSKTQSLIFGKGLIIQTFPNPIKEELTVGISSEAKTVEITFTDLLGKVVFRQNTEGSGFLKIPTRDWQTGIYILTVRDGQKTFYQKVVKH